VICHQPLTSNADAHCVAPTRFAMATVQPTPPSAHGRRRSIVGTRTSATQATSASACCVGCSWPRTPSVPCAGVRLQRSSITSFRIEACQHCSGIRKTGKGSVPVVMASRRHAKCGAEGVVASRRWLGRNSTPPVMNSDPASSPYASTIGDRRTGPDALSRFAPVAACRREIRGGGSPCAAAFKHRSNRAGTQGGPKNNFTPGRRTLAVSFFRGKNELWGVYLTADVRISGVCGSAARSQPTRRF
jgi:hypothetical protein